jgi:hypothetical protein
VRKSPSAAGRAASKRTRRQVTRVRLLLVGLDRDRQQLEAYRGRTWVGDGVSPDQPSSRAMSADQRRVLSELQQRVDERVLQLARRGIRDPDGYIERRLQTLQSRGDKRFLRRAHLEASVPSAFSEADLLLWDSIDRGLRQENSRAKIRQGLIDAGLWRGSRQAFDKLVRRLFGERVRLRVTLARRPPLRRPARRSK